jgi:hypothetical protein
VGATHPSASSRAAIPAASATRVVRFPISAGGTGGGGGGKALLGELTVQGARWGPEVACLLWHVGSGLPLAGDGLAISVFGAEGDAPAIHARYRGVTPTRVELSQAGRGQPLTLSASFMALSTEEQWGVDLALETVLDLQ